MMTFPAVFPRSNCAIIFIYYPQSVSTDKAICVFFRVFLLGFKSSWIALQPLLFVQTESNRAFDRIARSIIHFEAHGKFSIGFE